jgi:hypothetical protein
MPRRILRHPQDPQYALYVSDDWFFIPLNRILVDVVKSRVQNSPRVPGQKPKYNWTVPSLAIIAREEGASALYKGFLPKVLRLAPGGGVLLLVVEVVGGRAALRTIRTSWLRRLFQKTIGGRVPAVVGVQWVAHLVTQ